MKGKDIFKDSGNYASLYDLIEKEAVDKLKQFQQEDEEVELTEEQADTFSAIMDYKFRAQEMLENSYLLAQRLQAL